MEGEFIARNSVILLIILGFLAFTTVNVEPFDKPVESATESKYDKKQDRGPVYHPLREKPYSKKTLKA